ncbi:MAG: ABC transporter permease [bacterium]|nr:ABC transporter permease [bacterium]
MAADLIIGILEQGMIYGIMALGVYITYTILDFPDLSVDGTFPLGIAVCFVLVNKGVNPWLALIPALLAGALAGIFTGLLHVKLKIRDLLSGILTMTALYSINYTIVGKASDFLSMETNTIFSSAAKILPEAFTPYSKLIVILFIALAAKFALDWYMRTKSGFLLRSAGDNEGLVVTLGKDPGKSKIIGLAIANGLTSLAGAVYCQYGRAFNVGSGTGTVVMGLAAVIIGTTVFKKISFLRITTGVLAGMTIYKACISIALQIGLPSPDTNLMITILFIITLVANQLLTKNKKGKSGVRGDA